MGISVECGTAIALPGTETVVPAGRADGKGDSVVKVP
jgi:hypothetical protein